MTGKGEGQRVGGVVSWEACPKCRGSTFKSSEWGTAAKETVGQTRILKQQGKLWGVPDPRLRQGFWMQIHELAMGLSGCWIHGKAQCGTCLSGQCGTCLSESVNSEDLPEDFSTCFSASHL